MKVAARLESVMDRNEVNFDGKSNPLLDAIHSGVRLASEVSIPRYIHRDIGATRKLRKAEVQTAARHLHAEFVECGLVDGRSVLKRKAEVARLIQTGARTGVLTEHLILRSGGKAGHQRRRNAHAKERSVPISPALIDAGGP